ncbi:MAG: fatty acid desaturase [Akkermansiaceae bacterium]|nr:fatty acid desaturase [Akkermansiaceae bacterium]
MQCPCGGDRPDRRLHLQKVSSESTSQPEAQPEAQPVDKAGRREAVARWKAIVAEYQKPNVWRASWQIVNTIGGYAVLWYLMYLSLSVSWWLVVGLAILAGGFVIRVFIIFHDCGHGSFFKSRLANDIWGFITGVLTFTPYYHWRWEHSVHHATTGHLERRGVGDVWTLTVEEYLASSRWKKFSYRLARNPFVLFLIAPLLIFLIFQRFPSAKAKRREKASVWIMNGAILILALGLVNIYGFFPWLIIQLIVMGVAGAAGFWLFYVQHQFEDAYWERGEDWDYTAAAMQGSSFYKLPRVLQWFSGNIGFHHIHHLSSRIPNYNLERCHRSDPMFAEVKPTTLFGSLKSLTFRLWDERARRLISFGKLKRQTKSRERDGGESGRGEGDGKGNGKGDGQKE